MKKIYIVRRFIFLSLMFLAYFPQKTEARAYDSYRTFRTKPISLHLDVQYYKTEANFSADGTRDTLPAGHSFQVTDIAPHIRWQFSDLALMAGINVANSESEDALFSRKNSLVNRIDIGGEYLFMQDIWYRFFGRLSYSHPLESVDTNGDTVLTSDGVYKVHPEAILNVDFEGEIYSYLKGGFLLRGSGLSSLATYGVGAEYRFSGYGLGGAVLGGITVINDDYTDNAAYRNNLNNRVNGGSKIFNAINPNYHNVEFNFNVSFTHQSELKVFAGTNILGSNTSSGFYVGANLAWVLDYDPGFGSSTPARPRRQAPEPLFKENTDDGVDQKYFKTIQPVENNYIQQIEGSPKSLKEATTPEEDEEMQINTVPKKKSTPGYKIKLRKK